MIYTTKLTWKQPKGNSDELKKYTKNFLVYALSIPEAEARIIQWCPSNYQDAVVEEVKQTPYGEVKIIGGTETFWSVKWMDDNDGTEAKAKPFTVIINAISVEEALKNAQTCSSFGEIEEVKKFKGIVDADLISEIIVKKA